MYANAKKGAPDALKAVGYEGQPAQNPVCKAILAHIGPGKKGADLRNQFERPPYGWSGDAIDGGLQVLLVAGLIRAADERGSPVATTALERKAIGKATFKVESNPPGTPERIQIRKVMQRLGVQAKPGEESVSVPAFLQRAFELAQQAGGDAPRPERPDLSTLEDIRLAAGNEQLWAIYNNRDELKPAFDTWEDRAKRIEARESNWNRLETLLRYAQPLKEAEAYQAQAKSILDSRLLLTDPDPVMPMVLALAQLLRDELNSLSARYDAEFERGFEVLEPDANWQQLEQEQRHTLLEQQGLTLAQKPRVRVESDAEIASTLSSVSISSLRDRVVAMPSRFAQIALEAAQILEPKARRATLPSSTLKSDADVDRWVAQVSVSLKQQLREGPVIV